MTIPANWFFIYLLTNFNKLLINKLMRDRDRVEVEVKGQICARGPVLVCSVLGYFLDPELLT